MDSGSDALCRGPKLAHTLDVCSDLVTLCLADAVEADSLAVSLAVSGDSPHPSAGDDVGDADGRVVGDVPPDLTSLDVLGSVRVLHVHYVKKDFLNAPSRFVGLLRPRSEALP